MFWSTLLALTLCLSAVSAHRAPSISLTDVDGIADSTVLLAPNNPRSTLSTVPRVAPPETPLAAFTNCSTDRQTVIAAAATAADALASAAATYVAAQNATTPRYAAWFGNYTAERRATVAAVLREIAITSFAKNTYICATDAQCDALGDVAGYVLPALMGRVFLCPSFFDAKTTGPGSQGGSLVGLAALWSGTAAFVMDEDDAGDLALANPDIAVYNAASYQGFAENADPVLP
ncbi:zincin [Auricularia subglabra TFB-10046 SS5]|nr:zincin [Auricularia subglabra TFB-10046 SS5]